MPPTAKFTRSVPESELPLERRIYVNRHLRMASVGAIGFDLDHTLAHYRGPAVEELAYKLTRTRLMERFGYPRQMLDFPYERDFVIRGLVVDKRRGHVLKMDYHNYVSRAYHGRRLLDAAERKASYRTGRVRSGSASYISVDTLFHLPEVYLYAVLVELSERGRIKKKRSFRKLYADVREAIDSIHGDGTLKKEILGNVGSYIRRDPKLGRTLTELRESGKKIFLLTNSEYYYTRALLGHLLDTEGKEVWGTFFDLIVVDAGKPAYFTELDRAPVRKRVERPEGFAPVVHGGNARSLEKKLGFAGDEVLYFGDHTYGDILRSKKNLGWRTAMVVEELEDELAVTRSLRSQLDEIKHWMALRGVLEADLSSLEREALEVSRRIAAAGGGDGKKRAGDKPGTASRGRRSRAARVNGDAGKLRRRSRALEVRIKELSEELAGVRRRTATLGDEVNQQYNRYWGPLFREGREMSRFGHQVKDFACVYMTRVSNLLNYHPNHYFRSAAERMPHETV